MRALASSRRLRAALLVTWASSLLLAGASCKKRTGAKRCSEELAASDPDRTIADCSPRFLQTRDAAAALAVGLAFAHKGDDESLLRWAERVGPMAGTAKLWRRVSQAHERAADERGMFAAATRAMELWEQQGQPGEAAYEGHVLKEWYWERSELQAALQVTRRARALALASDDREMQETTFFDLVAILGESGDYGRVAELLREGQQLFAGARDEVRRQLRVAEGLTHFRQHNLELARLSYRDAVEGAPPSDNTRAAYYNLAEIEAMLGDSAAAARDLAAAKALIPAEPPPSLLHALAYFTAVVGLAAGDAAAAERETAAALGQAPNQDWRWQLELVRGQALEQLGRRDEALAAYRRAAEVVDEMSRLMKLDVMRIALRDRKRAPAEAVFALEAERGAVAPAMAVAQQLWQRGFVEAFAEPGEEPLATRPPGAPGEHTLAIGERAAAEPLAESVRRLGLWAASGTGSDPAATAADAAVDVLAFVEARGALWRYTRASGAPGGSGAPALQKLALPLAEARRAVAQLRARPEEPEAAEALARALLPAEVMSAAARGRPLAIIADGVLGGLPFAALRSRGRWLVQERVLEVWPALRAPRPLGEPAALAAPATATVLAATAGRGPGRDLAAARDEVVELARALGAEPRLGDQATIAALRGSSGGQLLHLAAHGGVSPGGAFVRMADGEVTVSDILAWRLAPRVVVLASCASGARPTGSIWGALGGAFLAAGSQAVVATLWSVEDAETARLMGWFYAAGGAARPAQALAAAQRQAIAAGVSPRQWSSFVAMAAPPR